MSDVCSNPNKDRKDYNLTDPNNKYALLYDEKTWGEIKSDGNFSGNGEYSAFPPPKATDQQGLFGNTDCTNNMGGQFNCNVGVVGLFPHEQVNTFRTNYDSGTKGYSLSAMDVGSGEIFLDSENDNICKKAYDKELLIDFGKYDKLIDAPITAMHKNWGSRRKNYTINGGVHVNNVSLTSNPITGTYKGEPFKQKCLSLTLRGSDFKCNDNCSWGLETKNSEYVSTSDGYIPYVHAPCPGSESGKDCNLLPGERVGACVASEYMLGPGYYEVIAHAPDITQYNKKQGKNLSNGYCWAIWTFHYEEHYPCKTNCDKFAKTNQFIDNNANNKGSVSDGYCYNEGLVLIKGTKTECYTDIVKDTVTDDIKYEPALPLGGDYIYLPGKGGPHKNCYGELSDYFAGSDCMLDTTTGVVNHEIDIEIPGSWPGKMSTDANSKYWTPSTWNCNTFLGSNNPALARGTWSSQYVIQKLTSPGGELIKNGDPNSFLATPPSDLDSPENENLEFHKYAFNWCVPGDAGGPYVQWYFDDEPIFKSYTMVPTRSSRLVVGGWFPHWTQEGNSDCKPSAPSEMLKAPFDTAKIFVKSILYKPNCFDPKMNNSPPTGTSPNTTVDFPQNYDQCGLGGTNPIANGFTPPNLPGAKLANGELAPEDVRVCNENCPTTKPPHSSKSPLMMIVIALIVLVVLAFLGLGVYMFINRKKSSKE